MLKLLETNLERVEKPASVKAQLVNAIKAMLNSVQHLSQVGFFFPHLSIRFSDSIGKGIFFSFLGGIRFEPFENMERLQRSKA
jgi:hypothetical protein